MPSGRELVVDYHSPEGPVAFKVRSTLLMSGLQALREFGYYDRYVELLPAEYHERILFAVAPEWLPIEVATQHYRACDELDISDAALDRVGAHVSTRLMGTFPAKLVRSGRALGATPWTALKQYDRLWQRILVGGGCNVEKVGPKDAIVRSFGIPMLESRYFRTAYQGVLRGAGTLLAKSSFVRPLPAPDGPLSAATHVGWV